MLKNENTKNISLNLVSHHTNPFDNLRENVLQYISLPDITLKGLSEKSGLSMDTLKSLLYGKGTDCKLSTAERLARALGISVNELIGSQSLHSVTMTNLANCRELPEHQIYLVRWFIARQVAIARKQESLGEKIISVFKPQCVNGSLKMTNIMEPMCVDHLSEEVRDSVYMGITLGCDHYMPYYSPYDTLLISANRPTRNGEVCVILKNDNIFIVRKVIESVEHEVTVTYVGLENEHYRISEEEVDIKMGRVVDVCHCQEQQAMLE